MPNAGSPRARATQPRRSRPRGRASRAARYARPMAEWIDLLDPEEQVLHDALPREIHERALEQLLTPTRHDDEPRPRLEGHDRYVFGVFLVPICIREENRVFYQEVDLIASQERLVTVRKTPEQGFPFDLTAAQEAVDKEAGATVGLMVYRLADLIEEDFVVRGDG